MTTLAYAPATDLRQSRWGTLALWLAIFGVALLAACLAWRQFVVLPAIGAFRGAHAIRGLRTWPEPGFAYMSTCITILKVGTLADVLLCAAAAVCGIVGLIVPRSPRRRAIIGLFLSLVPLLVLVGFYLHIL